jgi:hypothetical protein
MGWGRECDLLSSFAIYRVLWQGCNTIGGPPPPGADLGLEVGFDLVNLGELGERPAAVPAYGDCCPTRRLDRAQQAPLPAVLRTAEIAFALDCALR